MGTWGTGHFDSDTASDHLGFPCDRLVAETRRMMMSPKRLEPDEYFGVAVPCNLELLNLFRRQGYVGCSLPEPEVIEAWKAKYMAVWEAQIEGLAPGAQAAAHRRGRRRALLKTFDELVRHSRADRTEADGTLVPFETRFKGLVQRRLQREPGEGRKAAEAYIHRQLGLGPKERGI